LTQASSGKLRLVLGVIKWVIALGIVGWLVYQNWDQFAQLRRRPIHWEFLVAAFVLCGSSIILTFFRWYLLVIALNFQFRFGDALRLGFLGCLFNYVSPGAVGGDVVKAVLMAREQKGRRSVAVATILLDRILGLIGLLIVGAGATLLVADHIEHRDKIVAVLWGGSIAGLAGVVVLLHPATPESWWMKLLIRIPKAGGIIADIADGISLYQQRRMVVALTVALSVVGHFGLISSFYCCARIVATADEIPSYVTQLLLFPLAEIIGVIVPLPGGVGALEAAVEKSYTVAGKSPEFGLLAVGAYRITQIVVAAIGSVYYLASRRQIQELLAAEQARSDAATTDDAANPDQLSGTTKTPALASESDG
jgi:glycosyltransferase 2 family protein